MRILLVSKAQMVAAYHGLLQELRSLGVELTVVLPTRWGRTPREQPNDPQLDLRPLPCRLTGRNHFYFYTRTLEDEGFDLVHLDDEPWSVASYQWVRRARRWRKPLVFFTWQNIVKNYPPPFHYFERCTFGYAAAAIAGSSAAEAVLRSKGFARPISVFPQMGVDASLFQRQDTSALRRALRLEDKFVIGFAGRMIAAKGIGDLVHALALLPERCVLVMVGEGEARRETQELAERTGMGERIRWIAHMPSLRLPEYMSLFDVLALPSHTTSGWKEQFGRVLLEAMACGTPTVGSSSAEIPNVIGDAGMIFPEGDIDALAGSLRSLSLNAELRRRLAAAGRARVLQNFTHRKIAERTVQMYAQVLACEIPAAAAVG